MSYAPGDGVGPLAGAALLFAGCTYLTHEKQGELIFRPTRDAWWGFNANNYAFDEHWIDVGTSGQRLHAWWLPSEDANAPVVLYLHGARWNLGHIHSGKPKK